MDKILEGLVGTHTLTEFGLSIWALFWPSFDEEFCIWGGKGQILVFWGGVKRANFGGCREPTRLRNSDLIWDT